MYLYRVSVAEQDGLSLTWTQAPKYWVSCDEAQSSQIYQLSNVYQLSHVLLVVEKNTQYEPYGIKVWCSSHMRAAKATTKLIYPSRHTTLNQRHIDVIATSLTSN